MYLQEDPFTYPQGQACWRTRWTRPHRYQRYVAVGESLEWKGPYVDTMCVYHSDTMKYLDMSFPTHDKEPHQLASLNTLINLQTNPNSEITKIPLTRLHHLPRMLPRGIKHNQDQILVFLLHPVQLSEVF